PHSPPSHTTAHSSFNLFSTTLPPPTSSTTFPYTTLFRSIPDSSQNRPLTRGARRTPPVTLTTIKPESEARYPALRGATKTENDSSCIADRPSARIMPRNATKPTTPVVANSSRQSL